MKGLFFCKEIKSLFHMKEKINRELEGITVETFEKVRKNMNSRINHSVRVNGRHTEQYHL